MKKNIILILIIVLFTGIGVLATNNISSENVIYSLDNSQEYGATKENVQEAIDELYQKISQSRLQNLIHKNIMINIYYWADASTEYPGRPAKQAFLYGIDREDKNIYSINPVLSDGTTFYYPNNYGNNYIAAAFIFKFDSTITGWSICVFTLEDVHAKLYYYNNGTDEWVMIDNQVLKAQSIEAFEEYKFEFSEPINAYNITAFKLEFDKQPALALFRVYAQ